MTRYHSPPRRRRSVSPPPPLPARQQLYAGSSSSRYQDHGSHRRYGDSRRVPKRDRPRRQSHHHHHRERSRDRSRSRSSSRSPPPPVPMATEALETETTSANKVKVPQSLEEIQARFEARKEVQKPTFLSKAEREKMALERRREQVEAQKAVHEQPRPQPPAQRPTRAVGSHRVGRDRHRESSRAFDADRDQKALQKELGQIRERYLGVERRKRKIRKMNEKKFVFDWDAGEDTSQDFNPLYAQRMSFNSFGKGYLAGIDAREQRRLREVHQQQQVNGTKRRPPMDDLHQSRKKQRPGLALHHHQRKQRLWDDRHWSEKDLDEMNERDWRIFKEDFNITTKGGNIPKPLRKWSEGGLPSVILETLNAVGYHEPTPIQRQAIPVQLQNRDMIGIAETGSGKTASFVIPMLMFISTLPKITQETMTEGPYALILAPTRELAQQIESEVIRFATPMTYNCVSIVGGHKLEEQAFALRNGAEIIIATPGRLRACLDQRILVLNQCTYVVMDEADRMIDLGFESDVNFILDALPVSNVKPDTEEAENPNGVDVDGAPSVVGGIKYRQTTMFSATMPSAVERLAKKYLRRPAVATIGQAGQVVERIEQLVEFVADETRKRTRLFEMLKSARFEPPIIVFLNQKKSVDLLTKSLNKEGFHATSLHGGKSQEQREYALAQLKEGQYDVLVATDVAGRGIDVPDVSLVVNFDMAKSIEDYTHRIGRTGRAGKSGTAVTFLTALDTEVMYDLKQMLLKSSISRCPAELRDHEAAQQPPGKIITKKKHEETIFK